MRINHRDVKHDLAGLDTLSARVFMTFKSVMREQRMLMSEMTGGYGSHPAQAGCLQILARGDGLSHSDLAEVLHVSKPTITTMLQKMERAGLVERRPDDSDQRRTLVFLTEKGRKSSSEMKKVFNAVVEAGFGRMTDDDKRELARLLEIVSQNLAEAHGNREGRD